MFPVIAITCGRGTPEPRPRADGRERPPRSEVHIREALVDAVRAAGADAVLLPPNDGDVAAIVTWAITCCAGVLISGGDFDIHPHHYGRRVEGPLGRVDEGRTRLELALARACLGQGVPVLGICGGMQALAVASGGTLHQDIASWSAEALVHEQPGDPATPWHPVRLLMGPLRDLFGQDEIAVNSTHHQAVDDPGSFSVAAAAPDGVVEAIALPGHRFALGVQWHPEILDPAPIYALVEAAR